jgi:hypothetical protein
MTCIGSGRMVAPYIAVLIAVPLFAGSAIGVESAARVPDFSGTWAREYIGFEQPASGHGPIANRSRLPTGQSDLNRLVGDYTDPILKPQAAEIIKRRGEIALRGETAPDPSNQCWPMSVPYILMRQGIQLLQQKDQITILYIEDNQSRRIKLNQPHPAHVTQSWYGDSVGHYEGDTLVIDTIGIRRGPHTMLDLYGTPHSEALHVVERYRLIDYEAAKEAMLRSGKENIRILGDSGTSNGVAVDPGYRGNGLQVESTVEDANVLNAPWSAVSTFVRAADWGERICAENTHEYYANRDTAVPTAEKPDF